MAEAFLEWRYGLSLDSMRTSLRIAKWTSIGADLLSPARRRFIIKSGLMAAGAVLTAGSAEVEAAEEEKEQKRVVSPYREGSTWSSGTGI